MQQCRLTVQMTGAIYLSFLILQCFVSLYVDLGLDPDLTFSLPVLYSECPG